MKKRTAWARAVYRAGLMIGTGLLLAGCGGGGSASTSTSQGLTKEEFVAKALAICLDAQRHTAQFSKDYPGPDTSPRQAQQYFKEVAPFSNQAADKLAALQAPTGDKKVKALQDAYKKKARGITAAAQSPAKAKAALNDKLIGGLGSCAIPPHKS